MLGIELAKQTVFLMGISFMLGSLFSIFILLILEMLRSAREAREQIWEELHENTDDVDVEVDHAENQAS